MLDLLEQVAQSVLQMCSVHTHGLITANAEQDAV